MYSSPRRPYRARTSPYGQSDRPPMGRGLSPSSLPPNSLTPSPRFFTPLPGHQSPPVPPPNFSTPPPWGGSYPPVAGPYLTPPYLPPSPLSTPYGTPVSGQNSPASFYSHPDMPSPMVPPQKRKRFAPIRGRSGGGWRRRPRLSRGGRHMERNVGIDAYYDPYMFEDPWKDLLLPSEKTTTDEVPVVDVSTDSSSRPNEDEPGSPYVETETMESEVCSKECNTLPLETASSLNCESTTEDTTSIQAT